MRLNIDLTAIITFFLGLILGSIATYIVNKLTDKRRKKEAISEVKKEFLAAQQQMPELIAEIKNDLLQPGEGLIREFFLSNKGYVLNAGSKCFVYYEDDHSDLQSKIHILENLGFIIDITPGNAPKYRMTEEFVQLVLST